MMNSTVRIALQTFLLSAYIHWTGAFFSSYYAQYDQNARCMYLTASPNEYDGRSNRSIGDVVNNLHGGKYQFQESYVAGSSKIGREFAESLYASDEYVEEERDDEMPQWALRMMDTSTHLDKPITGTLTFECEHDHTITIKNDERSWEKFYAFVLKPNQDEITSCPYKVQPNTGTLAPRGGASNACDANAPYSDNANINIKYTSSTSADDFMLVVGTEAEVWRYLLKFQ